MAESCLAGVLAPHRGIDELSGLRSRGTWAKSVVRLRPRLLSGARVLVLGRGSSARRFAELLGPLGCPVSHFACGPSARPADAGARHSAHSGDRAAVAFRNDVVHRCPAAMPPTAPGRWSAD
ncbi:hypothetical protein [Streptomyces sp. NPDC048155]|uniref:hypothetical protein n=1 Tax=Streptomyces sp. NPDC048155 TaxID=3154818 RepID=UPI0033DA5F1C